MNEQALVHVPTSSQGPAHQGPAHQGPAHQTALHRAAMMGNSDAIMALIQGGCALDLQNKDGNTSLHEASWHGFSQCVKLLVKAGADVHVRNKAGNTALHLACQNAHAHTARLLLLGGSNPDTKNNAGDTCLHVAARYNNQSLVKILVSSMCSVTEPNKAGDTALHVAAALNHKKTVQLLLEAGTDGKIRNNAGKTALDQARDNSHRDLAVLLSRAPQVHRFIRGRTIRKRRDRLIAERRTRSVSRVEILPHKEDGVSAECPNGEHLQNKTAVKVDPLPQQQQQQQQQQDRLFQKNPANHSHGVRKDRRQTLYEDDPKNGKNDFHTKRNPPLSDDFTKIFTLFRDEDGNVRQVPADGCHCNPSLKKMEDQMKATEQEMRLHILTVKERVNTQLGKMEQRNKQQMKVLKLLNRERAAAERRSLMYRMERRAAQDREEALHTQAALSRELKMWWMSQLQDLDVQSPTRRQYYKLLPSPSAEISEADADPESLPLLSLVSGDSSASLANYVNILPPPAAHSLGAGGQGQVGRRAYFEMRLERSPADNYENTAMFPPPPNSHVADNQLGSADPLWHNLGVQHSPPAAVMPVCGEGFASSSSQSSISERGLVPPQQRRHRDGQPLKALGESTGSGGRDHTLSGSSRTLECVIAPTESSFSHERNSLHAMEVTQRFFDTVSTQLERWYQRKLAEVEQQMELRAQQDRKELMQQISSLEEELQRLSTNEGSGSPD